MKNKVRYAVENGVVFIEDEKGGEPPDPSNDDMVKYTSSCISVACLHEIDGEAEFILGPSDEVDPGYEASFDGEIETPTKKLVITSVEENKILQAEVPGIVTRVRVWRNHPLWADQVVVGWA